MTKPSGFRIHHDGLSPLSRFGNNVSPVFLTPMVRMRLNDGREFGFIGQVLRGENLTVWGRFTNTKFVMSMTKLKELYRVLMSDYVGPLT